MASAALSVLTLQEPIIPLVSTIDHAHLRTAKVVNKWTDGTTTEQAKMVLPTVEDPSNKELFLYVVSQFFDAADNDRLHLSGAQAYSKFREVLGGDIRLEWQALSDADKNKTIDTFYLAVYKLIGHYFAPSSFEDQKEYLRNATKPPNMSCEALGARLRVISRLGILLPGANKSELYATDMAKKRAYFLLMPSSWRIKFAESGQNIDASTYSYMALIRFMAVQEAVSKRSTSRAATKRSTSRAATKRSTSRAATVKRKNSGGRGGYGNQRGGRGHIRSGQGNGRGRGNYGNYTYNHYAGYAPQTNFYTEDDQYYDDGQDQYYGGEGTPYNPDYGEQYYEHGNIGTTGGQYMAEPGFEDYAHHDHTPSRKEQDSSEHQDAYWFNEFGF